MHIKAILLSLLIVYLNILFLFSTTKPHFIPHFVYNTYTSHSSSSNNNTSNTNVILIIADDLGIDMLEMYKDQMNGQGRSEYAATPTLDKLVENGIRFNRAYSYPTCSPTRATILTGRHGFRTGISVAISSLCPHGLEPSDPSIPRYLPENTKSAIFGKWHLSSMYIFPPSTESIIASELDYYEGLAFGFINGTDYNNWDKTDIFGNASKEEEYLTSYVTDAAIEWVKENQNNQFMLWLAHYAPHAPYHRPPTYLTTNDPGPYNRTSDPEINIKFANAALEALDTELERFFNSIDEDVLKNTLIIFLGDNGNDAQNSDAKPFATGKTKQTVYEGGIRVPFFVTGKGVDFKGATSDSLISTVDLFSTILDVMGGLSNFDAFTDSVSIEPLFKDPYHVVRNYAYSELYGPGYSCDDPVYGSNIDYGDAIIGNTFKLVSRIQYGDEDDGEIDLPQELYNLKEDPFEINNLLKDGEDALDLETYKNLINLRFQRYILKNSD